MPHTALALHLTALLTTRCAFAGLMIRGRFGIAVRSHLNLSVGHHQLVIGTIMQGEASAMGSVTSAMLSMGRAVHCRRPRHPHL